MTDAPAPEMNQERSLALLRAVEARLSAARDMHLWASIYLSPRVQEDVLPGLKALIHELLRLREHCRKNLS